MKTNNRVKNLREKHPKFVYEKYSYNILNNNFKMFFQFKIEPDIIFSPEITIKGIDKKRLALIGDRVLNNLVFHIGLIEVLSYWKAASSPEIIIKAGYLNKEQIKWWKDLIFNGMGQFFYENNINFTDPNFLKISNDFKGAERREQYRGKLKTSKVLVPVGGGKDSVITMEILKRNINCFSLNPTLASKKIMKAAHCQNPIIVERRIDKNLLKLNQKGYLNGHTPFSAYLAFLSVLLALIFDHKFIAFSNERSSNEGNLKYLGRNINHQWSKSFQFENLFRKYSKKYLAKEVEYFSFLRPLYEIQIAKLFSKYPKYFFSFLSCNEAHKTNSGRKKPIKGWCGKCPKCLFVFAVLYPFLKQRDLIRIFKKNLFTKKELLVIMKELIGERKFKPFECVGTKKESLVAFYLSWEKASKLNELPFLLKYFEKKILPKHLNLKKESQRTMKSWNNQHNLPVRFKKDLKYLTNYIGMLQ